VLFYVPEECNYLVDFLFLNINCEHSTNRLYAFTNSEDLCRKIRAILPHMRGNPEPHLAPHFPYHRNTAPDRTLMSLPAAPASSTPPSAPRPVYSASTLFQGNSSFGFHGVYPAYQPIGHDTHSKREQDLKKRRVSDSRRQRTPMSCDRCKVRKIKVCLIPLRCEIALTIIFFSVLILIQAHVITALV
jgi:hypothetical protein